MNTATIFYNDSQWLSGQPNPFGIRYDASILPMGSVVAGFMVQGNGGIQELLDPPYLKGNQEQSWNTILAEARTILQG